MSRTIFRCVGGAVRLPDERLTLVDAADGGNLIVTPSREVWERSELAAEELVAWSFLVAATGRAMIDALPQLAAGCVNYWEAGNWALNVEAEPRGEKSAPAHRRMHMHLLGRSRGAKSPAYAWGEAPKFPDFVDRHAWARAHRRLSAAECRAIVERVAGILVERYSMPEGEISPTGRCETCAYPMPRPAVASGALRCEECRG